MRSALVRVLFLVFGVSRNLQLEVNLLNLNDSLLRYYQGVPDRVLRPSAQSVRPTRCRAIHTTRR
jgi:hypothetical protein